MDFKDITMPGVAKIWTIFLHYFDILWRGVGRDFDEIWVVLYHAEFLAKFTSRKCSGLMITDDDTKLLYQQIAHLIVQIWADQKSSINNGGRIIIKLKMKVIVRPCRISISLKFCNAGFIRKCQITALHTRQLLYTFEI